MMGSFPTSMLIGKLIRGINIREQGSGNAGGFNVLRVLGWKPALVLVVFDMFKGWLPAFYLAPVFLKEQIYQIRVSFRSYAGFVLF